MNIYLLYNFFPCIAGMSGHNAYSGDFSRMTLSSVYRVVGFRTALPVPQNSLPVDFDIFFATTTGD